MKLALVVGLSLLLPALAHAEVDSPLVKRGLAAYTDLDYAGAVQALEQARGESLTREEKLIAYRTLGLAYAAMGNNDAARTDFQHLLRIDPTASLDRGVAPKVRAVFEEAKAQVATSNRAASGLPQVAPTIDPAAPHEGQALTVRVAYPGGMARKMTLYFRGSSETAFARATVDASGDGHFAATVPGLAVHAPALDYHVVLLDDAGASVATAGSLGQPLEISVARVKTAVYKRGWFWGVLAGVAVVGAGAAVLAVELSRTNSAPITVTAQ
jgi:tetratricopeptide (TPR) repeat protein